jgi:hypothetical protein
LPVCSCPHGQELTGDGKACVNVGEQPLMYFERTSGVCTDVGEVVSTSQECKEGAVAVGWSSYSKYLGASASHVPPGCYLKVQLDSTTTLFLNNNLKSPGFCSSIRKCLCKLTCSPSTYQDQTSKTSCKNCQNGKYSLAGKSSCDYDKTNCPLGTHSHAETVCALCIKGQYNDENGQSRCKSCVTGQYNSQTGQSQCTDDCYAGSSIAEDKSDCVHCASGQYQPEGGQSSCISCVTGKYSDLTKQTYCKSCLKGQYSDQVGSIKCSRCQKGRWQDLNSQSGCKSCSLGKYVSTVGSVSCLDDCDAGSYIIEDKSSCDVCPFGQWQNKSDQSSCNKCVKGKVSRVIQQLSDVCEECIIGLYNPYDGHTGECLTCLTAKMEGASDCAGW